MGEKSMDPFIDLLVVKQCLKLLLCIFCMIAHWAGNEMLLKKLAVVR